MGMARVQRVLLGAIVAFLLGSASAVAQELRLHFLSVGQGDSILIECPAGGTILVDAGSTQDGPRARANLARQLAGRHIDTLVLTHPDADHYNLVPHVFDTTGEPGAIVYGGKAADYSGSVRPYLQNGLPVAEAQIRCPGAEVAVLSADIAAADKNNQSIVLGLRYNDRTVLLMGDAEEAIETRLEGRWPAGIRVDVLKVGHHGSETSSGEAFIDRVAPRVAVISAGRHNSYHHPRCPTVDRLARAVEDDGAARRYWCFEGKTLTAREGTKSLYVTRPDDGEQRDNVVVTIGPGSAMAVRLDPALAADIARDD